MCVSVCVPLCVCACVLECSYMEEEGYIGHLIYYYFPHILGELLYIKDLLAVQLEWLDQDLWPQQCLVKSNKKQKNISHSWHEQGQTVLESFQVYAKIIFIQPISANGILHAHLLFAYTPLRLV